MRGLCNNILHLVSNYAAGQSGAGGEGKGLTAEVALPVPTTALELMLLEQTMKKAKLKAEKVTSLAVPDGKSLKLFSALIGLKRLSSEEGREPTDRVAPLPQSSAEWQERPVGLMLGLAPKSRPVIGAKHAFIDAIDRKWGLSFGIGFEAELEEGGALFSPKGEKGGVVKEADKAASKVE